MSRQHTTHYQEESLTPYLKTQAACKGVFPFASQAVMSGLHRKRHSAAVRKLYQPQAWDGRLPQLAGMSGSTPSESKGFSRLVGLEDDTSTFQTSPNPLSSFDPSTKARDLSTKTWSSTVTTAMLQGNTVFRIFFSFSWFAKSPASCRLSKVYGAMFIGAISTLAFPGDLK